MLQKEVNRQKYSFKKYSNKYPKLYKKEYSILKKAIPFAEIEHVGSSAVKNLGGKGIIDIMVCINKKMKNSVKKKLESIGYKYIPHDNDEERMFFYKIIKYKAERRIHVHLTRKDTHDYKSMIAVRNLLQENSKICKDYTKIKKGAVRYAKGDGKKYMKFKNSYLKALEKKAIRKYFKE